MIQRVVLVIVGVGFFVALVLAWYHGERGRQQVSGSQLLMVTALLAIAGGVLALLSRPAEAGAMDKVLLSAGPKPSRGELPPFFQPHRIHSWGSFLLKA